MISFLGYFIFKKIPGIFPKLPDGQKMAQSGHPGIDRVFAPNFAHVNDP
jgi:hypothetical protein